MRYAITRYVQAFSRYLDNHSVFDWQVTYCLHLYQVADSLKQGYQAMVFVHSRKDTGKTAKTLVGLTF